MNPNTNELRIFDDESIIQEPYIEVPFHLQDEAKLLLNEAESVVVTDKSSPLAKWAQKVRKNQQIGKYKQLLTNNK